MNSFPRKVDDRDGLDFFPLNIIDARSVSMSKANQCAACRRIHVF